MLIKWPVTWFVPVIPGGGEQRTEDCPEFETSLYYRLRLGLNKVNEKTKKKKKIPPKY